jgi:hypothetical protein
MLLLNDHPDDPAISCNDLRLLFSRQQPMAVTEDAGFAILFCGDPDFSNFEDDTAHVD